MGSLLLLPLELEAIDVAPSLSMHELRYAMYPPLEVLTCSANGTNLF